MNFFFKTIFLLSAFLLLSISASAGFDPNFNFSAQISDQQQGKIVIDVRVSPGHMLYRKHLSLKSSIGTLEVEWPTVTEKKDPFGDDMVEVYPTGSHQIKAKLVANEPVSSFELTLGYQGCAEMTCFMPTTRKFNLAFNPPLQPDTANASDSKESSTNKSADSPAPPASPLTTSAPVSIEMSQDMVDFSAALANKGIYWVLLLAFLGGLLVSLTPCVYPMIPITLSIIGSRNENLSFLRGLALTTIYVAGLSLTYALLGLAAATFGAQIRGFIQGSIFQGLVSIIFFLLALSMFDLILIQAPASLRNRLSGIKKTGLLGIFFMGMISGLMASPCVAAPLAGILAFIASTGSQILGFFMLLLFAWGMSVPLLLIGAFSGSMNALPKAGEWMNRVKEFYGFLLLAAALYFAKPLLGIALAELGTAALLGSFAAFLGLFTTIPENAGMQPRVLKSFAVVAVAVACAFAISAASQWGCLCLPKSTAEKQVDQAEIFWQHDLKRALAESAQTGKTVFVDFRAEWCSVCKDLELNVFPHATIGPLLKRIITVKIDATSPDDEVNTILKQYGIVGLPTMLFIGPDGKEMQNMRVVGYISPDQLEKKIRSVL
ncbi:MAG: protein-disulfide reductase DsbD [Candidatus Riflebacteria bacterium]|nr:protein-disulfide reductase DsbD [Candidatus Riflebacteria bacterium]